MFDILVGSCRGDSGNSLHIFQSDLVQHVQKGIVSAGPQNCGTFDHPGIYTKLESYLSWILDHVTP